MSVKSFGEVDTSPGVFSASSSRTAKIAMSVALAMAIYGPSPQIVDAHGIVVVTEIHDGTGKGSTVVVADPVGVKTKMLRDAVNKFKGIARNWDGQGAAQPLEANVDKLLAAMKCLPPELLDCTPMIASDGEVGLYWSRDNDHAELSVDSDGTVSLYLRDLKEDHGMMFDLHESPYLDADMVNNLRARIG